MSNARRETCARCGHSFAKHRTPGCECVQVIGLDAQGFEVYCECGNFIESGAHVVEFEARELNEDELFDLTEVYQAKVCALLNEHQMPPGGPLALALLAIAAQCMSLSEPAISKEEFLRGASVAWDAAQRHVAKDPRRIVRAT